jgi:glycosyltransferase involved in cell wall biosynthesis
VVIGVGREERKLKRIANKNIKFAGLVSEKKLESYYRNAKALIMPQEEDFGLVALEAQGHGVPVIAYKKGGAIDTVIPGKTGIFFEEQNIESLLLAIKKFDRMEFDRGILIQNAKRNSFQSFRKKILRLI